MNIHHCIFKILGKNQNVTDGHMDGRKDRQRENSIPHHKQSLQGGGGMKKFSPNLPGKKSQVNDLKMQW